MKRGQIEEKARDFCKKDVYGCNECCYECVQEIEKQKMIDLANWALSHQWVSVEDEFPPIGEIVFVTFIDHKGKQRYAVGERTEVRMQVYGVISPSPFPPVTHWMPSRRWRSKVTNGLFCYSCGRESFDGTESIKVIRKLKEGGEKK